MCGAYEMVQVGWVLDTASSMSRSKCSAWLAGSKQSIPDTPPTMNKQRATGLHTLSIEMRAIAPLAHCASTRSALNLDACTQLYSSTKGWVRRRRGLAEPVIGATDPKIRCCMALWSSTQMRSSKVRSSKVEGYRDSCAKSLKRICVADVWNMVSFARNARDVVTSI